jgi:hypothetical protein
MPPRQQIKPKQIKERKPKKATRTAEKKKVDKADQQVMLEMDEPYPQDSIVQGRTLLIRELSELELQYEVKKQRIMWTGVTILMVLIFVFWISNLRILFFADRLGVQGNNQGYVQETWQSLSRNLEDINEKVKQSGIVSSESSSTIVAATSSSDGLVKKVSELEINKKIDMLKGMLENELNTATTSASDQATTAHLPSNN